MEPLTKREQIYALALGLGVMWQRKDPKDKDRICEAVKILGELVDESDRKELADYTKRTLGDAKKAEEFIDKWSNLFDKAPKESAKDATEPMHEMERRDAMLVIAIGIAKLIRSKAPPELVKPGLKMLVKMATQEDFDWSCETLMAGWKKCGCSDCQEHIEFAEKCQKLKDEMDKPKEEKNESDDDDNPWRTFCA